MTHALQSYSDLGQAADAAARGDGSLVGSVVCADAAMVADLVSRLAPWHGRILVLDRTDAAESTGHGVAMPQMLHGGPGRTEGGEELGGLRAVRHYLQRTAVQGHLDLLARLIPGGAQDPEGER